MIIGIIDKYVIFSRKLFASGLIPNTVSLSSLATDYGVILPLMGRQEYNLINYFETGEMSWFDYGSVKENDNIAALLRPDGLHLFAFNEVTLTRFCFKPGNGAVYVNSDIKEPGQALRAILSEVFENPYRDPRPLPERIRRAIEAVEYRCMLASGTLQLTTVDALLKLVSRRTLKAIPNLPPELYVPLKPDALKREN